MVLVSSLTTFFSNLFILGSVRTVLADKKGTDTVSSKHTENFTTGINDTGFTTNTFFSKLFILGSVSLSGLF